MAHPTRSRTRRQIRALRTRFAQRDGLPFADVLPAQRIEDAIADHGGGWREEVFTPVLTLWAFLTQVICPVGSGTGCKTKCLNPGFRSSRSIPSEYAISQ